MPHINLLPWRETLKRERLIRFSVAMLASAVLVGLVMLGVHIYIEGLIDYQNRRNDYLRAEIKKAEAQIKEIETLEKKKQRLIERMNIIQELESNRPKIVHLFDELVRQLPDGMYFTEMEQKGDKLTLKGIAQSEARVSSLMRNVEKSEWLKEPKIIIIETKEKGGKKNNTDHDISTFELEVTQTAPKGEAKEENLEEE